MELKTIGTKVRSLFDGGEDRGVSPVIGVILMVAITVILAAVIGAFVLGLGDNIGQNPQAAVTFDDNGSNAVHVQITSVQAADSITISGGDSFSNAAEWDTTVSGEATMSSPSARDSITVDTTGSGTITVTAELDGNATVIQSHDYDHA